MTHKDLVKRARAWLTNNQRCTVVLTEFATTNTRETPDAIGFFSSGGSSILVECKTSRADFLADNGKAHRQEEYLGMGNQRYYLVPAKLVKPQEVPPQAKRIFYLTNSNFLTIIPAI